MIPSGGAVQPAEDAFRREVRSWFACHAPSDWKAANLERDEPGRMELQRKWFSTLAERGFHAPHLPKDLGGGGLALRQRATLYEEWARAGAPALALYSVSLYHMPSTLLQAGNIEQQRKYIPGALRGDVWCQGFSEPDAGSDLASLRTQAHPLIDGSGYIVNGRKIWSSHAAHASYCLLLARTSTEDRRQAGITYLIVDMKQSGIGVTPILQTTGQREFCEVTFDDVFVPVADRIGDEGDGWGIAQSTLSTERGPLALEIVERIDVARRNLADAISQDTDAEYEWHAETLDIAVRSHALRCLARDLISQIAEDAGAGGLSSVVKVASSDLMRTVTSLGSLMEAESSFAANEPIPGTSWFSGHWMTDFLNSWGWSIGAGSTEIQRNIIAERILGLPRG